MYIKVTDKTVLEATFYENFSVNLKLDGKKSKLYQRIFYTSEALKIR